MNTKIQLIENNGCIGIRELEPGTYTRWDWKEGEVKKFINVREYSEGGLVDVVCRELVGPTYEIKDRTEVEGARRVDLQVWDRRLIVESRKE